MKENDTINIKSKKMMLWAAMISMTMTFAGLTSAYVVSSQRPDWNIEFNFPSLFYWSTVVKRNGKERRDTKSEFNVIHNINFSSNFYYSSIQWI